MNISIEDKLICPDCGNDMKPYDVDEIEFTLEGKGHYSADVWCPACNCKRFISFTFNYNIDEFYMQ